MKYEEYYEVMRAESPEKDELQVRKNALTAANLDAALQAHRRKQVGVVRLVPVVEKPAGFINALFGAVETTGRMPAVHPAEQKEDAG